MVKQEIEEMKKELKCPEGSMNVMNKIRAENKGVRTN